MTGKLASILNEKGVDFPMESEDRQALTPLSLCVSIFIKYGMLGLVCVYFGYNIREKDQDLKTQSAAIVEMAKTQTAALTRNSEVMNNLSEVIKQNTARLEEIRRNNR